MPFFPAALQNLAEKFGLLPGIGGKTAQRLDFQVLVLVREVASACARATSTPTSSAEESAVCQSLPVRRILPFCDDDNRGHGLL